VYQAAQKAIWRINGTQKLLDEAKKPENYNNSAQVYDKMINDIDSSGSITYNATLMS